MKAYLTRLLFIALFITIGLPVYAHNIGFYQQEIAQQSKRPLNITLWYAANNNVADSNGEDGKNHQSISIEKVGDNIAFIGTEVIKQAEPKKGLYPLVVLSHGYRGSWRNLNWLAARLVQAGYLVAAVDHPGTTTFNQSPKAAAQWWQRPRDISRLLDWLTGQPRWSSLIDLNKVIGVGHSLGGWTVINLAGAKFDRKYFKQECVLLPNPRTCGLAVELGLAQVQPGEPAPNGQSESSQASTSTSLKDPRIKAVISLDLGLARSFSPASLSQVDIPSLILAAGVDIGDLPQQFESGYLAEHMPLKKQSYRVYQGATHFSFMQPCKPGAVEILEQEFPGDGVICLDGKGQDRIKLHQKIFTDIQSFLKQHGFEPSNH